MDEREARVGRNEALFRTLNERIEDLNATFAAVTDVGFEVVCECGDMTCVEQIPIPTAEYARVRTDPTLFILVPGHEDVTVEAVVEEDRGDRGAYVIVRKHPGEPADFAAEKAPD